MDAIQRDNLRRQQLAERYLVGDGYEVGAGLRPTSCGSITGLTFIDYRDRHAFKALFGEYPPYTIVAPEEALRAGTAKAFLIAHHVLEHAADPIGVLTRQWLPLIELGGTLLLSVPSHRNACEDRRMPTPIEHILDDFYFGRDGLSYESVQHIPTFVLQWCAFQPSDIWYADRPVPEFCGILLDSIKQTEQDLHWHTYTMQTLIDLTETAFYAAGFGIEWLEKFESDDSCYIVARKVARLSWAMPSPLAAYKARLTAVAASV